MIISARSGWRRPRSTNQGLPSTRAGQRHRKSSMHALSVGFGRRKSSGTFLNGWATVLTFLVEVYPLPEDHAYALINWLIDRL